MSNIMDFERIREIRNRDNIFASNLGICTTEIGENYARGELIVKENCRNLNRSVHGGCLYTMADTIGSSAASSHGYRVATVSGHLDYLVPGLGTEKLFCEAEVVKAGKRISVCEVKIYSDSQELLVIGLFEYARLKEMY